jgi:hypothetical protein
MAGVGQTFLNASDASSTTSAATKIVERAIGQGRVWFDSSGIRFLR